MFLLLLLYVGQMMIRLKRAERRVVLDISL